jgi:mannose/fructose/N-acetylgalactosamine-specific phosphotransferase system component IID
MKELLTSDVGLMSLAVIVGIFVIGGFIYKFVTARMAEDEAAARK